MEQKYLPGALRDRMQDLLRARGIRQSELAKQSGIPESTLSRFLSGAHSKLSHENIAAIANVLGVSTDFLLGLSPVPERVHCALEELGLSAQAAEALYRSETTAAVINALLENASFPALAQMMRQYIEGTTAAGYAAQNQMYTMLATMLAGENRAAADAVKNLRLPIYQADVTHIQSAFLKILHELREANGPKPEKSKALTKEIMQKMLAELPKGKRLLRVTPEQILDAVTATVSGMDGVTAQQLADFRKAALPLFHGSTDAEVEQ